MPHKEIIEYNGKKIEVITLDTEVNINQSTDKILKEIDNLIDEADKYERNGKLNTKGKEV